MQQQEQQKEQQQQQQQPEQEDDDFFNYKNNDMIEKFESYYCDDEIYDGDIYYSDYERGDTWRQWKDDYCDSDIDNIYIYDWYDKNNEEQPQYLDFLNEYFEYYDNN